MTIKRKVGILFALSVVVMIAVFASAVSSNRQRNADLSAALMIAVQNGNLKSVDRLLSSGADANTIFFGPEKLTVWEKFTGKRTHKDNFPSSSTPVLLEACLRGYSEIAVRLVRAHADVNICDYEKKTPLHHAVKLGDANLVEALLDAGAITSAKNHSGQTPAEEAKSLGHTKFADMIAKAEIQKEK